MHQICEAQAIQNFSVWERGSHEILPLTELLLVFDSCWKKEGQFFFNTMTLVGGQPSKIGPFQIKVRQCNVLNGLKKEEEKSNFVGSEISENKEGRSGRSCEVWI